MFLARNTTNFLFAILLGVMLFPAFLQAQTLSVQPARDARGVIPDFYSFGNEVRWCISLEGARKVAKDANELLYLREENDICRQGLSIKGQKIENLEAAVAEQSKSIEALERSRIALEGRARLGDDRIAMAQKQLELKEDTIKVQAEEIKKLSAWYRSPVLWFGIGATAAIAISYKW